MAEKAEEMEMRRLLIAAALVVAAVAGPASAGAAETYNYAAWGWSQPTGPRVDFRWGADAPRTAMSDRWTVDDCDGDGWFLCIDDNGRFAGVAELVRFPIASDDKLERQLEERGRRAALRGHARRFYRIFSDDREQGCPEAYEFRPLRISDATVAGRDGVRYGFIVQDGDGKTVERIASFATLTKTDLVIVNAEGLNARACVGAEGTVFRPKQVRAFGPYLARLAADGRLPR